MVMWRERFFGIFAATCALLLVGTEVSAQPAPSEVPPPEYLTIDANGVNILSGQLQLQQQQASVGDPADGGLARVAFAFDRHDNFTGGLTNSFLEYYVTLGSTSEKFDFSPFNEQLTSVSGSGRLVHDASNSKYIYTLADGTEAIIDQTIANEFAPQGLVTSLTRPNGEKLTFTYTTFSTHPTCGNLCYRLQAVTSNRGYMIKYEYAGSTLPASRILSRVVALNLATEYCDPAAPTCSLTGAWSQRTYTGQGVTNGIATSTDSLGRMTSFTFSQGFLSQIVSPASVTTTIARYPDHRVQSITSPAGTWTYAYGTSGGYLTTTVTDPLNHTTTYLIGDWGRVIAVTNGAGETRTFGIDSATGRITAVVSPELDRVEYIYNDRGMVTTVTRVAKPNSGLPNSVTTLTYPANCSQPKTCNRPMSVTEGGATTDYTYADAHGGVLTVTEPPGMTQSGTQGVRPQTRYTYTPKTAQYTNSSGVLTPAATSVYRLTGTSACATSATCAGAAEETLHTYTHDNNLLVSADTIATLSNSATTSYGRDAVGNVIYVDGPLAGDVDRSGVRYDVERQVLEEAGIDPDGAGTGRRAVAQRYTHAPDGKVLTIEAGSVSVSPTQASDFAAEQVVTITYDAARRKAKEALSAGGVTQALTQYSYDLASRLDCVAVRMNAAAFASPPSACVAGVEGADGPDRITKYTYDNADRQTLAVVGYGTPDERNEVATTYYANGTVKTVADGKGNVTTYEYDGFDRPTKTLFPAAGDYTQLSYNNTTWDVSQFRRRDGSVVGYGAYDWRGNVIYKNSPEALYAYDNFNRLKNASEGGQSVTINYDGLGRVTSTVGIAGAVSYQYDVAGRRTRMTWPGGFYVTYVSDYTGAVTQIRENGATTGLGVLATFAYDNLGRRTSLTRGNSVITTYVYDPVSRLATLTQDLLGTTPNRDQVLTFTYNSADQIVSRTSSNSAYTWNGIFNEEKPYTINSLNQLTAHGAVAVTHDVRGNISSDGVTTYQYDPDNRLLSATNGTTLSYDPQGRLSKLIESGVSTRFLYDGNDLIAELNSVGAMLRRYVHGPGVDEPLVTYDLTSDMVRRWLIADNQGSIVGTTDDGGVSTGVYTYDAYGVPEVTGEPPPRFRYTGQTWIPSLSLYHYKARTYSAIFGRFLQPDPTGYDDGMNMYAYVGNDPANLSDPMGLSAFAPDPFVETVVVTGNRPRDFDSDMANSARQQLMFDQLFGGNSGSIGPLQLADNDGTARARLPPIVQGKIAPLPRNRSLTVRQTTFIPLRARVAAMGIRSIGKPLPNTVGGKVFGNKEGLLPKQTPGGNPITYREYDIVQKVPGVPRGPERVVIGSDGNAWYTASHYKDFMYMGKP